MNHGSRTEPLTGEGVLARAEALHARLGALLARDGALTLDLSEITAADLSLVQLLVSAALTAEGAGLPLTLTGFSPELRALLAQAGLAPDPVGGHLAPN